MVKPYTGPGLLEGLGLTPAFAEKLIPPVRQRFVQLCVQASSEKRLEE